MTQRWFESANDVRLRQMTESADLTASEQIELRAFLDRSGSMADRMPLWANWMIGIVIAAYFLGGFVVPFYWMAR